MPDLYLYGMLPDIIVLFYLFYKFYRNTYSNKKKNLDVKFAEKINWKYYYMDFKKKINK